MLGEGEGKVGGGRGWRPAMCSAMLALRVPGCLL